MITETSIEASLWQAVDQSLQEFFGMMVGEKLTAIGEAMSQTSVPDTVPLDTGDITVIVGWTGDLQGVIAISLTESASLQVTEALIDHVSDAIDQTVIDAIGELGNIVVGGAKRRMPDHQMKMSLPSVIRTGSSRLAYPSSSHPTRRSYEFADTPVQVIVAINGTLQPVDQQ